MRIYNEELDRTFNEITLILSEFELRQLRDYASNLIDDPSVGHSHILCEDYSQEVQKEIVLTSLLSGNVLGGFHPRIIEVIEKDR
jgi:hypothetical protein